jgi:hypothetical protein
MAVHLDGVFFKQNWLDSVAILLPSPHGIYQKKNTNPTPGCSQTSPKKLISRELAEVQPMAALVAASPKPFKLSAEAKKNLLHG